MSEEEIILSIKQDLINATLNDHVTVDLATFEVPAVQGLLDLYNKEKENSDNNYLNFIKEKCRADKLLVHYTKEKEKTANIQEQKMQFYNKGVEVTNKWWQDKIKDKVKELEQDQVLYETRQVLKEFLEGE